MNLNRILRNSVVNRSINVYIKKGQFSNITIPFRVDPKNVYFGQHLRFVSTYEPGIPKEQPLVKSILQKLPFFKLKKNKLMASGYYLYEAVADKVNYEDFFMEFDLPDTFYSWFVITELHLWMLSVRTMAEGEEGRFLRNCMLQALWSDVAERVKKVGAQNPSATREQIFELSEQLQAALIAYDEGLQSDDTVLAGAIWRRIYQQKDVDIRHLDRLVNYIRKHIRILDNLPKDDLCSKVSIKWQPPNSI